MADIIYFDSNFGVDSTTTSGTARNPYKTLDFFVNNIAIKNGKDYIFKLGEGLYTFQESTIKDFQNCTVEIWGERDKTILKQVTGIFTNLGSGGGYNTFTLNCKRLVYNIDLSLTSPNLNTFRWKWNFENVVFNEIPNNGYSVFSAHSPMIIKNCVKVTNTTNFLRKNSTTISVIDSYGAFTGGYQTTVSNFDKGGNTFTSTPSLNADFSRTDSIDINGVYSGLLTWHKGRVEPFLTTDIILILNDNKTYSLEGINTFHETKMTSNTTPAPFVASASSEFNTTYPAWKAFNGISTDAWISLSSDRTPYIQLDYGEAKPVNKMIITSRVATGEVLNSAPRDFQILGSNDGINFELITEILGETNWSSGETRYFNFENNKNYRYYRFYVLSNDGYNGYTSIGEILYGYTGNKLRRIPSHSKQNFINYGMYSPIKFDVIVHNKNYILTKEDSEIRENVRSIQINRKPLSIKLS